MTAPLPGAPVIITPAMRAADDRYRDLMRAAHVADEAMVDDWLAEARERVHGRLDAWLAGRAEPGRSA